MQLYSSESRGVISRVELLLGFFFNIMVKEVQSPR